MTNYLRNIIIACGVFSVGLLVNNYFVIPLSISLAFFGLFVYQDVFHNSKADQLEQKLKVITDRLTSLERKTNTKL